MKLKVKETTNGVKRLYIQNGSYVLASYTYT